MKLTEAQIGALKRVSSGDFLSFSHIDALANLERRGFIETVPTSFISQVHYRITEAGRTALEEQNGR
ncbi:MAG: hypothetical protein JJ864_08725 [Rhizobiaceae bacterium]|nr:hypothetical protein [Rhizobiaceae bacterium]